ncbi:hypothetical protein [Pseudomonas phage PA1C]|uniref:Uncharacterized protein n=1 Tax=Pseudomonas phage vB_PaeM_PS119XW TaxID=2601632 RepID=A0A5C1K7S6_9CAUD|nr:hypothetical protein PP933_gp216 [Pseudomonas phage vB_PaeM_PS119XW]QBX32372.1 hypothetical protein [Pseudomonas phage PA1C]QEM41945.1 hypothetical protein [Pseudomonas phage vB_PaeM_PS119XW]
MSIIRKIALKLLGVESVLELARSEIKGNDLAQLASTLPVDTLTNLLVGKSGVRNFAELATGYLEAEQYRGQNLEAELRKLVRKYTAGARINASIENIAVNALIGGVAEVENSKERNILKRKAAAMATIRAQMPGIAKADGNYAVELLLQIVKVRYS